MVALTLSVSLLTVTASAPAQTQRPWWRDAVCYEVFVRSFYDSDGDGIGDLRGLTARLDYINDGNSGRSHLDKGRSRSRSLGAKCIWLMPIASAKSYHGYDVTDYYHVDPHYGTDDDFRALVRAAHRRGIHVIVDFVPNHSSSEHPFFQAALKDPASPYRSWYRFSTSDPKQPGPWGQVAWHKSPLRDEYYYGVFWHEMPDLNYQNPAVMQEMLRVTRHWLTTMHADGLRFDAIPYLVEDGNVLMHSRGTHDVLRRFGSAIRQVAPQSFTVGEESDMQALPSYYPDQLDSYFEFGVAAGTLETARTGDAAAFLREIARANALPAGRWAPFLSNHDQTRVMTALRGDTAKARVAASAMLMLPGTPFVYYGEEIGMIGDKPDEQIRTPMQWSDSENAGFTAGKPWEAPHADWRTTNVARQDSSSSSLLNHYRSLIHLRNEHPALSHGRMVIASTSDRRTAAFLRRAEGETMLVVINFGDDVVRDVIATTGERLVGRLDLVHADPGGCGGVVGRGNGIVVGAVPARGLCVFRVGGRR
jgi:alpha-amylase